MKALSINANKLLNILLEIILAMLAVSVIAGIFVQARIQYVNKTETGSSIQFQNLTVNDHHWHSIRIPLYRRLEAQPQVSDFEVRVSLSDDLISPIVRHLTADYRVPIEVRLKQGQKEGIIKYCFVATNMPPVFE